MTFDTSCDQQPMITRVVRGKHPASRLAGQGPCQGSLTPDSSTFLLFRFELRTSNSISSARKSATIPGYLETPLTMKQTHSYSASQYVNETGFPLSWMCRCCITGHSASDMRAEAEEYHERNKTRSGTVIGRPAGREAYHGRSAMQVSLYPKACPDFDSPIVFVLLTMVQANGDPQAVSATVSR